MNSQKTSASAPMGNAAHVAPMEPGLWDGYGVGRARVSWFRWESFCKPGKWDVNVNARGIKGLMLSAAQAVVDDFGALVVVEG